MYIIGIDASKLMQNKNLYTDSLSFPALSALTAAYAYAVRAMEAEREVRVFVFNNHIHEYSKFANFFKTLHTISGSGVSQRSGLYTFLRYLWYNNFDVDKVVILTTENVLLSKKHSLDTILKTGKEVLENSNTCTSINIYKLMSDSYSGDTKDVVEHVGLGPVSKEIKILSLKPNELSLYE